MSDEIQGRKVKLYTRGLEKYVANDVDAACHFVGQFAFCARKQGWTQEEIQQLVRQVTAKRAYDELMPFIEPVSFWVSPLSNRADRRYAEGCDLLAHDPDVKFTPFWELRQLWDAIKSLVRV